MKRIRKTIRTDLQNWWAFFNSINWKATNKNFIPLKLRMKNVMYLKLLKLFDKIAVDTVSNISMVRV